MTDQNAPFVKYERRNPSYTTASSQAGEDIYAVIVEIEQIAEIRMRHRVPIIALCDHRSQQNWVSQDCVDYLSKNNINYTKTKNVFIRGGTSGETFLKIRWSCGKLGQSSEEAKFLIEPKAHFKLMFGCGSGVQTHRLRGISNSTSESSISSNKEARISDRAAESFRKGINERKVLLLKGTPASSSVMGNNFPTIAELEQELQYLFTTHSRLDADLLVHDNSQFVSVSTASAPSGPPRTTLSLPSFSDSLLSGNSSNYMHTTMPPTTSTSISESTRSKTSTQPFSESQRRDSISTPSSAALPYNRRLSQPPHDQPHPWKHQPQDKSLFITPCQTLDSTTQSLLDEAKKKAEKEASEYWTWDATVGNYKHYDEGSNEPVWYNLNS